VVILHPDPDPDPDPDPELAAAAGRAGVSKEDVTDEIKPERLKQLNGTMFPETVKSDGARHIGGPV
jgi:hypothetical protein